MARIPYMKMFWSDFFDDPQVRRMTPVERGIYALVLGTMWVNEGWLPADDKKLANMIGLDVRSWRVFAKAIKPQLAEMSDEILGRYLTQKRLRNEWEKAADLREKYIANLPTSSRAKPARPAKRPPSTVIKKPAQTGTPNSEPKAEAKPVDQPGDINISREESSALQAESFLHAGPVQVTALPPRPSLGLGGRSVADEPLDAEPNDTLRKRLVADGLKRPSLSDIANLGRKS